MFITSTLTQQVYIADCPKINLCNPKTIINTQAKEAEEFGATKKWIMNEGELRLV